MAKSRLIGDYPVIGIRPTIDGRRGPLRVRESLEEQTMAMAAIVSMPSQNAIVVLPLLRRKKEFFCCRWFCLYAVKSSKYLEFQGHLSNGEMALLHFRAKKHTV